MGFPWGFHGFPPILPVMSPIFDEFLLRRAWIDLRVLGQREDLLMHRFVERGRIALGCADAADAAAAAADGPLALVAAKGTWNLAGDEDIMTMKHSYDADGGDRW